MPQIFHHSTNFLAKLSIFGAIFILLAATWVLAEINRSSWNTGQWVERQQPVQFSHKHHSGDDGIDCRYCHTSVETSSNAGMPPTNQRFTTQNGFRPGIRNRPERIWSGRITFSRRTF